MRALKLFLVINLTLAWLASVFLTLAACTGSVPWLVLLVPITNALLGSIAYRSLRKLQPRPQPAKPQKEPVKQPPKPLDEAIIKGLVKRGFTPELIERLWQNGTLTVT